MEIINSFSFILLKRRRELGYTQEYVAERCDLTTRQYQSLEKGAALPKLITALRLSIILDFSLDSLKGEVKIVALPLSRSE